MYSIHTPCPKGQGLSIVTANGFQPIHSARLGLADLVDHAVDTVDRKERAIQSRLDMETLIMAERDLERHLTGLTEHRDTPIHWPAPLTLLPVQPWPLTASEIEVRDWIERKQAVRVNAKRRGRRLIKVYSQAA